ncbi:hypothetical protein [Citrobacter arsenatis]|uniref:hypothetical protein n=1 Tax=Citrobacter arsenatis TaxID=2546350 RepID=UPI00300E2EB3
MTIRTAAGGLTLLAGASTFAAPQDLPIKYVSAPAYNIITDTLFNLTPQLAGKRNNFLMQQVCDLARGDKTQPDVNRQLRQNKIDIQKLSLTGDLGYLVTTGTRHERQTACTAWLATSLFLSEDNQTYFKKVVSEVPAPQPEQVESPGWAFWKTESKTPPSPSTIKKESVVFNQARFIQDARLKMAVARATAQLYAVTAQNIQASSPVSAQTYQEYIVAIVQNYAAEYLKSVDTFYRGDDNKTLTLESITASGYSIRNPSGNRLVKNGESIQLLSRGVPWLGEGKIMGADYFVKIAIVPIIKEKPVVKSPAAKSAKKK